MMGSGFPARRYVELRGSYGLFAAKHGWFHLYYVGDGEDRPEWMDIGERVSVYIIGPNGGLLQSTDPAHRSWGDETYVGEVVRIERLRLSDLESRHLMSDVPSCSSRAAILKMLRRRGHLDLVSQDPVEVVSIRRVSYAIRDLVGPGIPSGGGGSS